MTSFKREEILVMKTAYENLLKNVEFVRTNDGVYTGNNIGVFLGIDEKGVDFLMDKKFLSRTKIDCTGWIQTKWYILDLFKKLARYEPLYKKEDERFALRFKLHKIFRKENFEKAFDWVFNSDMKDWDNKMKCINYECSIMGCELTCGDTLGEAKKLYELLNN